MAQHGRHRFLPNSVPVVPAAPPTSWRSAIASFAANDTTTGVRVSAAAPAWIRPRRVLDLAVWDSHADFEAWFEANVKPAFPEGALLPSITFEEFSDVVTA
jgi:hypothetical protein